MHPVTVVAAATAAADAVPTTALPRTVCAEDVGDGDGDVGHSCGAVGGKHAEFKFCKDSGLRGDQAGAAT